MTVFAWDASDFDWFRGPMDMKAAAADGIVMVTHKATEAANTRHTHLADVLNRSRAAGIPILGAYHVVRSAPNVATQVSYFLAYLDAAVPWWRTWPGFVLQVDLEKWPYDPVTTREAPPRYLEQARPILAPPALLRAAGTGAQFAAELRARKPASACVIVYASRGQYGDTLTNIGSPLWNANYPSARAAPYRDLYTGDGGAGWVGYSGQTPALWQYASTARIGSQPGCDANAFRGTLTQLRTLVGATGTGGPLMALTDDQQAMLFSYVQGMFEGLPKVRGNTNNLWDWETKRQAWQVQMAGNVAAIKAAGEARDAATLSAVTSLAAVIEAGGGSVDSAAIVAAINKAAGDAAAQITALQTALAASDAHNADLRAKLAEALKG